MLRAEEVNGVKLHIEDQGSGPAIMTLHGGPGLGSRHGDAKVYGVFANEGYRVISYDQRGNGDSDQVPPYSHEQFVEDAEALRKKLGLGQFVLEGHSYGGHLALEYAIRYQENLSGLILGDTAASNAYHYDSIQLALNSGLPGISKESLGRLFGGDVHSDKEFREMYKSILPLYTVTMPTDEEVERRLDAVPFRYQTHNWAFAKNQPNFDIVSQLHTIKVPTLVMVGREDWITPVAASQDIAREIPNSKLVIFEHSGHGPQSEETDKYYATVRSFLSEVLPVQ